MRMVQAVSREPELFSSYDGPSLSNQPEIRGNMLVSMDGGAITSDNGA